MSSQMTEVKSINDSNKIVCNWINYINDSRMTLLSQSKNENNNSYKWIHENETDTKYIVMTTCANILCDIFTNKIDHEYIVNF